MSTPSHHDDIDFGRTLEALRRSAWALLLCALLVGAGVYGYFRRQTPVYAAKTMILSSGNQTGNQTVNSTLVSAPPLPPGALEGALASVSVLSVIREGVNGIVELRPEQRAKLRQTLAEEAAAGRSATLRISGQVDLFGNGTYTLSAEHPNPLVAAQLANLAADALVEWDTQRGLTKVTAARQALAAQLRDIENSLQREGPLGSNPTRAQRTLLNLRSNRQDQLNNLLTLERAVMGSLLVVAPAVPPYDPARPRPLRNGVLAGLFALFAAAGLVVLRASLHRTVATDLDLKGLELRLLGEVPRLRQLRRGQSLLAALHRGRGADSVAFLANNVGARLPQAQPKVVLVTSLLPGEGKSSLSAALADTFAGNGQRVLLLDADLRRPTQRRLWGVAAETADWLNLPGTAPFPGEEARDLQSALRVPEAAQARKLRDNLHLVTPASQAAPPARLSPEAFAAALRVWGAGYDVVVVDAPPALAVADPLALAPFVGGVLLVLEPGKASFGGVQRLVDALALSDANVIGVAFNKVDRRRAAAGYGYGYGYGFESSRRAPLGAKA